MLRFILFLALWAAPALADPERYTLEVERSVVGFAYAFGDNSGDGTMPVIAAELLIDLDRVQNSEVAVTVDVTRAQTGFILATEALRGPQVLDASQFPVISFRSTRVTRTGDGALIDGEITLRGVTNPITLTAQFYRQEGTLEGDRDRLAIYLTGSVSRTAFGASGFADIVGDQVDLRILAFMRREGT